VNILKGTLNIFFIIGFFILASFTCMVSKSAFALSTDRLIELDIDKHINDFVNASNKHVFYGLASYYNKVNYFLVDPNSVISLNNDAPVSLKHDQWLILSSRHVVLAIKATGLTVELINGKLDLNFRYITSIPFIKNIRKDRLFNVAPELNKIRYNHLWPPLAFLSKATESALVLIQKNIVNSWGWAVVIFACLLKLLLLPIGVITLKLQLTVSQVQAKLAPKVDAIKATCDGEEAHNRMMAVHKELGVSPFYTLKPLFGSLIQIPILIAVFNALGEMPQFNHQSFFWIENLAYPDVIGYFPITLFMFGNAISILPFIMTAITLYSTIIFNNQYATKSEAKRQQRNLYLMAAAFFILFYPFPSVMVLYWALANVLQTVQQQWIKV